MSFVVVVLRILFRDARCIGGRPYPLHSMRDNTPTFFYDEDLDCMGRYSVGRFTQRTASAMFPTGMPCIGCL